MSEIQIHRLHCVDGDHEDLGWYAKGHHEEKAFRDALEAHFWLDTPAGRERYKHPSEADETRCHFVQQWWINAFGRFRQVTPKARGAFPVTALLTPEAEI